MITTRKDQSGKVIAYAVWWKLNDIEKDLDYLIAEMPRLFHDSKEYRKLIRSETQAVPVPKRKPSQPAPETVEIPRLAGKTVHIPVR